VSAPEDEERDICLFLLRDTARFIEKIKRKEGEKKRKINQSLFAANMPACIRSAGLAHFIIVRANKYSLSARSLFCFLQSQLGGEAEANGRSS
jgi:hypothetical protein